MTAQNPPSLDLAAEDQRHHFEYHNLAADQQPPEQEPG